MKGRKIRTIILSLAVCIAAYLISGCGGSPGRFYDQKGKDVAWSDLNTDSIPETPESEGYFIGYGDVLDVNFLYETQYSRKNLRVRPDGKITYPLAGEIFVAGMTPGNLDSVLTDMFSEIILDPYITVIIQDFQPQQVYVLGEVGDPGNFNYRKGMTLTQALAMGNGYTDDARKSNVLVMRRIGEDHIIGIEVDIDAILSKNDFSLDVELKPFDIVYVPKSRIATTEEFIERLWTIIGRPMELYIKGWQIANIDLYYDYYARMIR
jgi:polysaccharide export outer membrane protein